LKKEKGKLALSVSLINTSVRKL